MTRKILLGTISAVALGAVVLGSVVPAAARGFGDGHGPRAGMGFPSFAELDANADGALSMDELQAPLAERFAAIDGNGDGALSPEEMQAMRPMGKDGMRSPRGMKRGAVTPEMRQARAEAIMERMDADGDGLLSLDELAAEPNADRIFERIDADGDGTISKEEFDAAAETFAGRMPRGGMMPRN